MTVPFILDVMPGSFKVEELASVDTILKYAKSDERQLLMMLLGAFGAGGLTEDQLICTIASIRSLMSENRELVRHDAIGRELDSLLLSNTNGDITFTIENLRSYVLDPNYDPRGLFNTPSSKKN